MVKLVITLAIAFVSLLSLAVTTDTSAEQFVSLLFMAPPPLYSLVCCPGLSGLEAWMRSSAGFSSTTAMGSVFTLGREVSTWVLQWDRHSLVQFLLPAVGVGPSQTSSNLPPSPWPTQGRLSCMWVSTQSLCGKKGTLARGPVIQLPTNL